jgi:riboflavin kinase / FMN adenylyltransferase
VAPQRRWRRFGVEVVSPVSDGPDDLVTSSSLIRDQLRAGNPDAAARLLGRWWRIEGVVMHGDKRGRTIGVPTANIALGDYLRPKFGVYAIRAVLPDGQQVDGIANIGDRPTVSGAQERVEAHLFDFDADLYGTSLGIDVIAFIRPEQKFDSFDALKDQIMIDLSTARQILGITPRD